MFDRDGNGEFNSKELTMLQDYLQMYGKEKDIKLRQTDKPLDFELFCLYVHEDLLRDTDEYNQIIEIFKIFDEDNNGFISSHE